MPLGGEFHCQSGHSSYALAIVWKGQGSVSCSGDKYHFLFYPLHFLFSFAEYVFWALH